MNLMLVFTNINLIITITEYVLTVMNILKQL